MPLVLADRVKETTTTAGTGTLTLDGAATGFQSFAVVGNGNTTYYTISSTGSSEWEVGIGTYTASGTTLSRDTVLASSAGAPTKTNFSAGTKDVFVTYTAARSVYVDGSTLDTAGMGAAQGDILYASATDVFSRLTKNSTATRYLANTGVNNNPQWDQINLANGVTGSLAATNGGTGQTSYVVGDLLYADSTTSLTKLADVATGNALISGGVGVAPSYGKIGLTTHVSGTLPIANGGSGQTTAQAAMNAFAGAVTSGQYLRGNGTNVVMSAIQAADVPTLNQNTTGNAATATNVAGLVANTFTTYGNTATTTAKNSYYGLLLGNATSHLNVMADTGGNGGFYRESTGIWPFYYNVANNSSGIGSSNTTSGYALQVTNRARIGPFAGSQVGNTSALEIFNNGGTGDSNLANITFHCTGQYGASLHLRPDGYMGMGGWSASAWRWYTYLVNGDMTAAGNVTAYSDPRLKEDITLIQSALEKIKKLDGVKFKWIESSIIGHAGEYDYGVLATQVAAVAPELVADSMHEAPEGDRYKTVAYDKLAPFLIEAVKELAARLEVLERGK